MSTALTDKGVVSDKEVDQLARERKCIPDKIFYEVLNWLPVATADFVLTRVMDGRKEFMLGYRAEEPFKDTWFVTGGRLNWGESPDEACKRHVERELGLADVSPRFVGHVSVMNPASDTRPLWHSIWHLYEVPVAPDVVIKPNTENAYVQWFYQIDPRFPDPVRHGLQMMGFTLSQ